MNVNVLLIKPPPAAERLYNPLEPETFTALDVRQIMGLATPQGNVLLSRMTWERLCLFMDILRTVDFTCYEADVEELLQKWKLKEEQHNEQTLQLKMAEAGQSEVAGAEKGPTQGTGEAKLLPEVRAAISPGEIAGPSPWLRQTAGSVLVLPKMPQRCT
jgi:hypothetical protein